MMRVFIILKTFYNTYYLPLPVNIFTCLK